MCAGGHARPARDAGDPLGAHDPRIPPHGAPGLRRREHVLRSVHLLLQRLPLLHTRHCLCCQVSCRPPRLPARQTVATHPSCSAFAPCMLKRRYRTSRYWGLACALQPPQRRYLHAQRVLNTPATPAHHRCYSNGGANALVDANAACVGPIPGEECASISITSTVVASPISPKPGTLIACSPTPGKPTEFCCNSGGARPAPPGGSLTCGMIKCYRCAPSALCCRSRRWSRVHARHRPSRPSASTQTLPPSRHCRCLQERHRGRKPRCRADLRKRPHRPTHRHCQRHKVREHGAGPMCGGGHLRQPPGPRLQGRRRHILR
jgi:hypothetical protein